MSAPEIDISTFAGHHANGAAVIDVRETDEYDDGHVAGARLIPLGEVQNRLAEFPVDGTVYLICRSGARSGRAAEWLLTQGVDAVNIAGGTLAWIDAGHPVVLGGEPG